MQPSQLLLESWGRVDVKFFIRFEGCGFLLQEIDVSKTVPGSTIPFKVLYGLVWFVAWGILDIRHLHIFGNLAELRKEYIQYRSQLCLSAITRGVHQLRHRQNL